MFFLALFWLLKAVGECREYIGPLLHAAILIACVLHPEFQMSVHRLRLCPELTVTGRHGFGPVDYILMYRAFMVVVAELCSLNSNDCIFEMLLQDNCDVLCFFVIRLFGNTGKEGFTRTCTCSAHCADCKRPGQGFLRKLGLAKLGCKKRSHSEVRLASPGSLQKWLLNYDGHNMQIPGG